MPFPCVTVCEDGEAEREKFGELAVFTTRVTVVEWSDAPARSSVEMIMKPKSPVSVGQVAGVPDAGVGHCGLQSVRQVISKVRSTPGGLSVAWTFSVYLQELG